jgi:hypothetical protein
MTKKFLYLRNCAMAAIFIGVCGYLWGCGARSVMLDTPEGDPPTLQGTGGAPTAGGTPGTSAATGGTSWAGGGAGGTPASGGTGGTPASGGTGGTPASGGTGGTPASGGTGGTPASGGTGGTPASGGTGGTPASGGTGGGFIGSCEYPSCLWNLIRDCPVVGQCTEEASQLAGGSTNITELCCRNGVYELITFRTQGSRITGTVAVSKSGNKCYDVNITTSADGNTAYYVWLDPSGQAVAKATIAMTDSSTPIVKCGNGESMPMTDVCAPDGSQAAEITAGACP